MSSTILFIDSLHNLLLRGAEALQIGLRSDLNAARSSELKSSGCSQAAKCPPLSTSFQWMMLPKLFSPQLRGARYISAGNTVTATGKVGMSNALNGPPPACAPSQYDRDDDV